MKEEETLLSGVEYKVRTLIKNFRIVEIEKKQLEEVNKSLQEQLEEKNKVIKSLEDKLKTVKLAKSLGSQTGNEQAKIKIDELVREIDKCIRLLNV